MRVFSSIVPPRLFPFVLCIALISLLIGPVQTFLDDPGVGWHLATGEFIRIHGFVPRTDPFLAHTQPRSWISDQWLSDLLFAYAFQYQDFLVPTLVTISMFIVGYFLLFPLLMQGGERPFSAIIAMFLAFKIAQIHFILRPVIASILLFSVLFYLLYPLYHERYDTHYHEQLKQRLRRYLFIVPAMFMAWANLHPGFATGFVLLGLIILGLAVDCVSGRGPWPQEEIEYRIRELSKILILSVLATLINPYGYELHQSILELSQSSFFMSYHQEWIGVDFRKPEGAFFECMLFLAIIGLVIRHRTGPTSAVHGVLLIFFVHASFDAVRFLPSFGVIAAPLIARSFSSLEFLYRFFPFKQLTQHYHALEAREARAPFWGWMTSVLLFFCVVSLFQSKLPWSPTPPSPQSEVYPYQELRILVQQGSVAAPIILAADARYGGFITWQGQGKVRAIIDDRNTLLGEEIYKRMDKAIDGDDEWLETFIEFGASHILVRRDTKLAQRLIHASQVREIASSARFIVYELKTGKSGADAIQRSGIPTVLSQSPFVHSVIRGLSIQKKVFQGMRDDTL
jgi:hypothetical protein